MTIDILPMTIHEESHVWRGAPDIKTEGDGELLRLAGKGHEDAWEELVRRFDGLIHRVAKGRGLNHSDAGDVAQVTWWRLSGNIDRLRDADRIASSEESGRRFNLSKVRPHTPGRSPVIGRD